MTLPTKNDMEALTDFLIENAERQHERLDSLSEHEQLAYLRAELRGADVLAGLLVLNPGEEVSELRSTFIRGMDIVSGKRVMPEPRVFVLWSDEASLALLRIGYGEGESDHTARVALRKGDPTATDRIAGWLCPVNDERRRAHVGIALDDPSYTGGPRELQAAARYVDAWRRGEEI